MVNLGLIGYGFHGRTLHQASQLTKEANVVAVLDTNPAKMQDLNQDQTTAHSKLKQFLEHPQLEGIVIATPTKTHLEIFKAVAPLGLPVELEKPMAQTYSEAKKIAQIAKQSGIPLMIGLTTNYRPEIIKARAWLAQGQIGELIRIEERIIFGNKEFPKHYVEKENGGGTLLENGIHALDNLLKDGGPISELYSAIVDANLINGAYWEDNVSFDVRHTNGVQSRVLLMWTEYKYEDYVINYLGRDGCIVVKGMNSATLYSKTGPKKTYRPYSKGLRFDQRHLPGDIGQLNDFVRMIRGQPSQVPIERALEAHRWIEQIYDKADFC